MGITSFGYIYGYNRTDFLKIFILYWSTVDLQCCDSFKCIPKWFSYTYTYIYLFQNIFPFRLLQNIKQSSLCYTVGPCWLSILNIVVCMSIPNSQFIPPPQLSPLVTINFFSKSVRLFLFCTQINLYYFLDSTYKG